MPGAYENLPAVQPACVAQVVGIVRALSAELSPARTPVAVCPHSHLERDLGLHSMERLELVLRLEEAFAAPMPDAALDAEYVRDLASMVGGHPPAERTRREPPAGEATAERLHVDLGSVPFTVYAALLVLFIGSGLWLLLLVVRSELLSRSLLRRASQALLRAWGCPLEVRGLEHIQQRAVFVANHQSYLDSVVLLAALPVDVTFVVNERLPTWPLIGTAIRRAGHLVVNRAGRDPRLACTAMAGLLRRGESLLVFPEGTFADAAELLPFRLGGFSAAVDAGRPVIPVSLRGSRHILPAFRRSVVRGPLSVTIHRPIHPAARGWAETLRLRDEAMGCIGQALTSRARPA
ncbi:MAG: 1-acyl-sn-glycerol-3-phosphate acyltransferase [Acidobacteriota bacterium]|nr:1-acyl-sn-glycerol-3-phosphate acyltransferase [Acidobacteriota bacterium]